MAAAKNLPIFQCRTKGCPGLCLLEAGLQTIFLCDICNRPNCLQCEVNKFYLKCTGFESDCEDRSCAAFFFVVYINYYSKQAIHDTIPCETWKELRRETNASISDEELLSRAENFGYQQMNKLVQDMLEWQPKVESTYQNM